MNKITPTADGSNTLFNETIGEHYHSKHGAVQESKHVFIEAGLKHVTLRQSSINILEVGFGTGLNFLFTLDHCINQQLQLNYTGIEAFPLSLEELRSTGYQQYVPDLVWKGLEDNYALALNEPISITADQQFYIAHTTLANFTSPPLFDLIYFDAFSVQHQPEMWSDEIIAHVGTFLKPGGVFITYAITGKLKRALKAVGFTIEKLPGAPGKREMLRATKAL
ncbi:hypothetical protein PBAL39_12503 [Pedobacter sp. BAL39]|uniref:tRNA (5-methylaminomethyl-2-thiouridine)(34)-methyltransferase MnmD n=1 Tax=Pedobacter sp. BAL39 TaxID=391596 RepID=UPI000155A299|nr:tRNA (5-methylaminomethyl-2-thiouridine)(34)-methyltransferase MnmD [Pedobacter sp. BAL39]EDM34287.1 hypothetical protein PBAL39_12503 [Pedobacter sp. BAL39]